MSLVSPERWYIIFWTLIGAIALAPIYYALFRKGAVTLMPVTVEEYIPARSRWTIVKHWGLPTLIALIVGTLYLVISTVVLDAWRTYSTMKQGWPQVIQLLNYNLQQGRLVPLPVQQAPPQPPVPPPPEKH